MPKDAGWIERAIVQGTSSAAVTIPEVVALGPVGGSVALGVGAGMSRRSRVLDAGGSQTAANLSGLGLGALEALTELGPGGALKEIAKGSAPLYKEILKFFATELPGENIVELAELVDDYRLQLRDNVTVRDVLEAVRDTSAATIAGGGTQLGAFGLLRGARNMANARAEARARKAEPPIPDMAEPAMPPIEEPQAEASAEPPYVPPGVEPGDVRIPEGPDVIRQTTPPVSSAPGNQVSKTEISGPRAFTNRGGSGEASYVHLGDGRVRRKIVYSDGETHESELYTNNNGDEVWIDNGKAGSNDIPVVVGRDRIGKLVDDDLLSIGASPPIVQAQTSAAPWEADPIIEPQKPVPETTVSNHETGAQQAHGPFGPVLTEFKGNARGAIAKLMELKSGEAVGALHHPDIGYIDLVWGEEGSGVSDGYGIAKLAKYHPEVLSDLQGIISSMSVVPSRSGENRVRLESTDHAATVRLTWDNQTKHWLLTAYEKRQKGRSVDATTTDTGILAGTDDTASHAGASDAIVTQKNPETLGSPASTTPALPQQPPSQTAEPDIETSRVGHREERPNSDANGMRFAGSNREASSAPGIERGPGAAYVGMYQSSGAPAQPMPFTLGNTTQPITPPAEPIRREHIMAEFQRLFGVKVYQGKPFKVRGALGFHRPKTGEVRIKNKNDLEVTAHEVFHWIDREFPTLRKLYHESRFHAELTGVSYDAKKVNEGFAEFGRLFMTKETEAAAKAPNFYAAFVAETRRLGIHDKLSRVQLQMHQWYLQGAEARALSKIGSKPPGIRQRLDAMLDGWGDRAIQATVDRMHSIKIVEREVVGKVGTVYESVRLLAGARNIANQFINYGTLRWSRNGDLEFSGEGLKQIFESVGEHMDDAMAYFVQEDEHQPVLQPARHGIRVRSAGARQGDDRPLRR